MKAKLMFKDKYVYGDGAIREMVIWRLPEVSGERPHRLELLKQLKLVGPSSVRALSIKLQRDYKNVHSDVKALEQSGLLERTSSGAIHAPWDVIDAHLNIAA